MQSCIASNRYDSRKSMLDGRLPRMDPHEHPHVEIDGQAEDGLDVPSVPRRRGRDHG